MRVRHNYGEHDDVEPPKAELSYKAKDKEPWRENYIPPGTYKNPHAFWVLPGVDVLLADLRRHAGRPKKLVQELAPDMHDQELLMVQIMEEIESSPKATAQWNKLVRIADRASFRLATDNMIERYMQGEVKHTQLIMHLSKMALPEVFGVDGTQQKAAEELEQEMESMKQPDPFASNADQEEDSTEF